MARRRVRAAKRKGYERSAHEIASGVYTIAMDLRERAELPLPIFVTAPLVYICEMMAAVLCKRRGWDRARADQVARYLMAGVQEVVLAMFGEFDEGHFEAWVAAAELRDAAG